MSIREILIHPDPRLKKACDPVADIGDKALKLAEDMLETMYAAPGIGLAAPQVGVNARLFVMDCAGKEDAPDPIVFFNPSVTWASDELRAHDEGCLSIPDQYEEVIRPSSVKVGFTDRDGQVQEKLFEGLEATCVQHEIDHLNGVLFIDHLSALKRRMITEKMKKLKRERARA